MRSSFRKFKCKLEFSQNIIIFIFRLRAVDSDYYFYISLGIIRKSFLLFKCHQIFALLHNYSKVIVSVCSPVHKCSSSIFSFYIFAFKLDAENDTFGSLLFFPDSL